MLDRRHTKIEYNVYDFLNGEICFITTADREFGRRPDEEVLNLLANVADNGGELLEFELVALNRWLMHTDDKIDYNSSKSKKPRQIKLTKSLLSELQSYLLLSIEHSYEKKEQLRKETDELIRQKRNLTKQINRLKQ